MLVWDGQTTDLACIGNINLGFRCQSAGEGGQWLMSRHLDEEEEEEVIVWRWVASRFQNCDSTRQEGRRHMEHGVSGTFSLIVLWLQSKVADTCRL